MGQSSVVLDALAASRSPYYGRCTTLQSKLAEFLPVVDLPTFTSRRPLLEISGRLQLFDAGVQSWPFLYQIRACLSDSGGFGGSALLATHAAPPAIEGVTSYHCATRPSMRRC